MPINPEIVGYSSEASESEWDANACMLYALGVGAGTMDSTAFELEFTTENSIGIKQKVLPTFPVVVPGRHDAFSRIGTFDRAMLVHGEQSVELYGPIPSAGRVSSVTTVTGAYDKGSAAVIMLETVATDVTSGNPMWATTSGVFIRGEGGWGGDRGPSKKPEIPQRPADYVVIYQTRPEQALLYRLCGDHNPLHSDPQFAAKAGFDRPILHGLCTFGFTGRALLHSLCDSDPARFVSMSGRFSKPVFCADELRVTAWVTDVGRAVFRTSTKNGVVLEAGELTYVPA